MFSSHYFILHCPLLSLPILSINPFSLKESRVRCIVRTVLAVLSASCSLAKQDRPSVSVPGPGAHGLQFLLAIVHQRISAGEDGMERVVRFRIELRHAEGGDHIVRADVLLDVLVDCGQDPVAVLIILTPQEDGKLIAADPEDRAVLEDLTDELAGLSEVLVSGIVSLRIIDFLEVVDVAVNEGKFRFFPGKRLPERAS